MGDSEGDCQEAGCTGYERLVSSEYEYDPMVGIFARSFTIRSGNPRCRHSLCLRDTCLPGFFVAGFTRLSKSSLLRVVAQSRPSSDTRRLLVVADGLCSDDPSHNASDTVFYQRKDSIKKGRNQPYNIAMRPLVKGNGLGRLLFHRS